MNEQKTVDPADVAREAGLVPGNGMWTRPETLAAEEKFGVPHHCSKCDARWRMKGDVGFCPGCGQSLKFAPSQAALEIAARVLCNLEKQKQNGEVKTVGQRVIERLEKFTNTLEALVAPMELLRNDAMFRACAEEAEYKFADELKALARPEVRHREIHRVQHAMLFYFIEMLIQAGYDITQVRRPTVQSLCMSAPNATRPIKPSRFVGVDRAAQDQKDASAPMYVWHYPGSPVNEDAKKLADKMMRDSNDRTNIFIPREACRHENHDVVNNRCADCGMPETYQYEWSACIVCNEGFKSKDGLIVRNEHCEDGWLRLCSKHVSKISVVAAVYSPHNKLANPRCVITKEGSIRHFSDHTTDGRCVCGFTKVVSRNENGQLVNPPITAIEEAWLNEEIKPDPALQSLMEHADKVCEEGAKLREYQRKMIDEIMQADHEKINAADICSCKTLLNGHEPGCQMAGSR